MYNPIPPSPMPARAVSRIALQFNHLHEHARVFELPTRPGDASYEKHPHDASPNLDPPPQPIETAQLKTS